MWRLEVVQRSSLAPRHVRPPDVTHVNLTSFPHPEPNELGLSLQGMSSHTQQRPSFTVNITSSNDCDRWRGEHKGPVIEYT